MAKWGTKMSSHETLLVAGASGQLGRSVLKALVEAGAPRLIATTRTPEHLAEHARDGVEVRFADYSEPQSLVGAFQGATRMLLISTQGVGVRVAQHVAALEAAKAAGVEHVFYTSHMFPDTSVSVVAPEHAAVEKAIFASGLKYTMLRNCLYSENLLMMLAGAFETGTLYGAANGGKVAFISRRDCAAAAAGGLLHAERHENKIYDVTGPRSYSYAQVVKIVSGIIGRTLTYVDLTPQAYMVWLLAKGVSLADAEAFLSFERSNGSGDADLVTNAVLQLSGREPERLEDFLRNNLHKVDPARTLDALVRHHVRT